jgi:hypothetical protein
VIHEDFLVLYEINVCIDMYMLCCIQILERRGFCTINSTIIIKRLLASEKLGLSCSRVGNLYSYMSCLEYRRNVFRVRYEMNFYIKL